jgi:hypothetical protein
MGCDERDEHDKWRRENRVEDVSAYLIRNTQQRADDGSFLWWSTRLLATNSRSETAFIIEHGWSSLGFATVFETEDPVDLPPGGAWVSLHAEVETLDDAVPSPEYAGLVNRTFLSLSTYQGEVTERTEVRVEDEAQSLYVNVHDTRGEERQHYAGHMVTSTYMSVSGTDLDGVRARFAELTS